ncbi:NADH-quinone oxidoreductase subunit C [bacterium]|nr:NADH-quinone oxidoreductase subunit C [bacterium]
MNSLIKRLKMQFDVEEQTQRSNLSFINATALQLPALLTHLRDYEKYTQLIFLTAVDRIEDNQFQLTYMLADESSQNNIGVRVRIDRENAVMTSIAHLWHHARTYQQELREMFGIDFPGSPGVNDNFILEGWEEIPPMRRDFDTREYSEKTYFPRPGRSTTHPRTAMKAVDPDYPELPLMKGRVK